MPTPIPIVKNNDEQLGEPMFMSRYSANHEMAKFRRIGYLIKNNHCVDRPESVHNVHRQVCFVGNKHSAFAPCSMRP